MSRSNRAKVQTNAITPAKQLTAAVAAAGAFTLNYPTGYTVDDFTLDSVRHVLAVGATQGSYRYLEGADYFSVAFAPSSITVTWNDATTIPINSWAKLQLDVVGSIGDFDVAALPSQVRNVAVVELDLGKPDTASGIYFRAAAALGAGGALVLLQTTLDVPRNLIFTSAGNDTGITFAIVGTDEYAAVVKETVTGANANIASGKKAFSTITSITASGAAAGNLSVGFGDVLGLPIWLPSASHILGQFQDGGAAVAGTVVAGLARATVSTATTADVRGTYDPNAACDGTKHFSLLVAVDDPTYKGNQQFDT